MSSRENGVKSRVRGLFATGVSHRFLQKTAGVMACLALASCSSGVSNNNGGGNGGGPNNPSGDTPAAPTLDIQAAQVAPNGCLDLAVLTQKLRDLPQGAVIRENTQTYTLDSKQTIDGHALQHPRTIYLMTALASLYYQEAGAPLFISNLSEVSQDSCKTVVFKDKIGGKTVMEIDPSSTADRLDLKSYSTKKVDGQDQKVLEKEWVYSLKSPRELEIKMQSPAFDPCPDHDRVPSTTVHSRVWGTQADLQAKPLQMSAELLKKISSAVDKMPAGIDDLLSEASGDMISPAVADIATLKTETFERSLHRCPYEANPPGTDEAPPAEAPTPAPDAAANPTPTPTPTPTPSTLH